MNKENITNNNQCGASEDLACQATLKTTSAMSKINNNKKNLLRSEVNDNAGNIASKNHISDNQCPVLEDSTRKTKLVETKTGNKSDKVNNNNENLHPVELKDNSEVSEEVKPKPVFLKLPQHIVDLKRARNRVRRYWQKYRDPADKKEYNRLSKEVRREVAELRKIGEQLELVRTGIELFRELKRLNELLKDVNLTF